MNNIKYLKFVYVDELTDCPKHSISNKQKKYNKNSLYVRCGIYIYNVTTKPNIYNLLAF